MDGPLFIVGAPRSGTTLLLRLLQTQSKFRPHRGYDLQESQFLRHPWPQTQRQLRHWQDFIRGPFVTPPPSPTAPWARRWLFLSAIAPSPYSSFFWNRSGMAPYFRTYLEAARCRRNVQVLVEKTPYHRWFVPHLLSTFPNAKVLAVVRDPQAVYQSVRRRSTLEANWAPRRSLAGFALRHWLWERRLDGWKKRWHHRIQGIHYETLVEDPGEALQHILKDWGWPWEDRGLDHPPPYLGPETQKRDPHLGGPIRQQTRFENSPGRWEKKWLPARRNRLHWIGTPPSGSS